MPQQLVNGSYYKGSVTITYRQSDRYAVVNPPEQGKHRKTEEQRKRRHFINQISRRKMGSLTHINSHYGLTVKGGPLDDIRVR